MIESKRLYMRLLVRADAAALQTIWGSKTVMKYCDGAVDTARINRSIDFSRADFEKFKVAVLGVAEKKTDALIGAAGCMVKADNPRRGELIYHFAQPYWGCGYASEIVAAYIEALEQSKRMDVVHASVLPDNAASIRVLQKCGFVRKGFVHFEDTGYVNEPYFEFRFD